MTCYCIKRDLNPSKDNMKSFIEIGKDLFSLKTTFLSPRYNEFLKKAFSNICVYISYIWNFSNM